MLIWLVACVEPFEAELKLQDSLLVIDGNLTDQPGINYVNLRRSYPSSTNSTISSFVIIKDAEVWLMEDNSARIDLHYFDGSFVFPDGFTAQAGKNYQLFFKLPDGKQYESDIQKIKKVSPIKKVYQRYLSEGIKLGNQEVPGHKIYVDFDDPAGKGDAYYWTYRLFEKQDYCKTCDGGYYMRSNLNDPGFCQPDPTLQASSISLDYNCEVPCWQILPSNLLVAQNDAFTDGRSVIAKEIAEIPYYTSYGAVLEIKQHAISTEAYKYIKLLIDQNQNSGSLADTPSTALVGNVRSSTDKRELVGGYFVLSSVHVMNYFMTREDVINAGRPIGLLGRPANPEVSSAPGRPPLAPCTEGISRTKIQPPNWQNE